MVRKILFIGLVVALVGCQDDDFVTEKSFLENYEGIFWHWQDEKELEKQGGVRFYNDSTKIIQYFDLTYPSGNCWYMTSLNMLNNTDGADYIITENLRDKFTFKSIDHETGEVRTYTFSVIGKKKDSLQLNVKSDNHIYFTRSNINPENLKYCGQ